MFDRLVNHIPQVIILNKQLDDCLEVIHRQALKIEDLQNIIIAQRIMIQGDGMAKCKRKPKGKK